MSNDLISRSALKIAMWDESHSIATFTECGTEEARIGLTTSEVEQIIDNALTVERPQGERAERALAIIDHLRTDGHINNKEQGVLRRAILLPERPQGEWLNVAKLTCQEYNGREYGECSICHKVREVENFCPHCGADMRGEGK